jgi:hypothetical protein
MIVKQTQRGFGRIEFKDRYDVACSLQRSSLASEDCVWLGCDEPDPKVCIPGKGWQKVQLPEDCVTNTRMHLTRQQAKGLLPHLQAFARTGEIEIIPPTKAQLWRKVAMVFGELLLCEGPDRTTFSICFGENSVTLAVVRSLIADARGTLAWTSASTERGLRRKLIRRIAKLEAALAAWEAA